MSAYLIFTRDKTLVIAGHKRPGNDDSPKIIEEARQYIRDFDRARALRQDAGALSGSGQPGRALEFSARRQTVI